MYDRFDFELDDARAAPPGPGRAGGRGAEREHKLLRALLGELPVPVFLLEGDGTIRRTNRAACSLLGVAASYPTGKPFAAFVDPPARRQFRLQLGAGAAGARPRVCPLRLLGPGGPRTVLLRLAPVVVPGEPDELVAVVALPVPPGQPGARAAAGPEGNHPASPGAPRPAGVGAGGAHPAAAARRADLMAAMTRLLLAADGAGEAAVLDRAAALLAAEVADWVLVDLVDRGAGPAGRGAGRLARRLAIGPDGALAAELRRLVPRPGELAAAVAGSGRPALVGRHDEPAELGRLPAGTPVGAALDASCALAVPLLPDGPDGAGGPEPLGVLTLVRTAGRPDFELAEVALLRELGAHLALAVQARRDRGTRPAPTPA